MLGHGLNPHSSNKKKSSKAKQSSKSKQNSKDKKSNESKSKSIVFRESSIDIPENLLQEIDKKDITRVRKTKIIPSSQFE